MQDIIHRCCVFYGYADESRGCDKTVSSLKRPHVWKLSCKNASYGEMQLNTSTDTEPSYVTYSSLVI